MICAGSDPFPLLPAEKVPPAGSPPLALPVPPFPAVARPPPEAAIAPAAPACPPSAECASWPQPTMSQVAAANTTPDQRVGGFGMKLPGLAFTPSLLGNAVGFHYFPDRVAGRYATGSRR